MTERMRTSVLSLLLGLYAAAAMLFAPTDLFESEPFSGHLSLEHLKFAALGIFLAPPALLAWLAVLGPWRWTVRLPLTTWLICVLTLLLTCGARLGDFGDGLASDPIELISICLSSPLAVFLVVLPPLALLRVVRRWRLEAPAVEADPGREHLVPSPLSPKHGATGQFTIRTIFGWTLAVASLLAGLRWVFNEWELGESTWGEVMCEGVAQGAIFGTIFAAAALPVLSVAWVLLAWQGRVLPRLALIVLTTSGIAAVIAWIWQADDELGELLNIAAMELGVVIAGLATIAVLRICGFRLSRRPRGQALAPQSEMPAIPVRRRPLAVALAGLAMIAVALACCVPARIDVWRKAAVSRHWYALGMTVVTDDRGRVAYLGGDADGLSDEELRRIANELPELRILHFNGFRDSQLAALAAPAGLESLCISDLRFTDGGLKALGRFPQLTGLDLSRTSITDAGLPSTAALKQLATLDLSLTDITDAGLPALAQRKNLRAVDLSLTTVTEAGARRLSEALPDATIIIGASDTALSILAHGYSGAVRLDRLHACGKYQSFGRPLNPQIPAGVSVTDAGLGLLNPNMELKELDLRATAVTDAGLPSLFSLKTLRRLDLRHTAVTAGGCKRLATALPKCEILR